MDVFMQRLFEESDSINKILSHVVPMSLTCEEEQSFQNATHCHTCDGMLGADRVRDHSACSLNFKYAKENEKKNSFKIPVIFHDLRGYDSHFIMESLGKFKRARLRCIANNMEKYISFSIGQLTFIDSLQFMNASLDKLVSNLANEGSEKFLVIGLTSLSQSPSSSH